MWIVDDETLEKAHRELGEIVLKAIYDSYIFDKPIDMEKPDLSYLCELCEELDKMEKQTLER